jgi:hypothetical protein
VALVGYGEDDDGVDRRARRGLLPHPHP